jgi:hypothetical protein
MKKSASILSLIGTLLVLILTQACATTLQPAATTSTVLFTEGSRQHTAMLLIALPPQDVYAGLIRIIEGEPNLTIINREDERYFIEVEKDGKQIAGQASDLGHGETLLFLWADAGDTGDTGANINRRSVNRICDELKVKCEVKN